MISIRHVDASLVAQVWPLVENFLSSSLVEGEELKNNEVATWNDCYNIHHVQAFLSSGSWLLVVAVDENGVIQGAGTISFSNYPMNRVAIITLTGGKFVTGDAEFEQLAVLLRQYGATKVHAYCRESMVRMLKRRGFEPKATLVEITI